MATTRRKAATPLGILKSRLRAFLTFLKPKLLARGADLDRLATLRRLSDVRIRTFCVGKPAVTGIEISGLLADDRSGRFDALAADAALVRAGHLAQALPVLGEEMGFLVEACLTLQILGAEAIKELLKEFVEAQGPAPQGPPVAVRPAGPAPLPEGVSKALGGVRELWAAPAAVVKVLQLLAAPDAKPDAVAAELQKAHDLAALAVRLAGQCPSGQAARPESPKAALAALGVPAFRRAVSAAAVLSALSPSPASWKDALRAAHAAALIARATKLGSPDEHFFAGLLRDTGLLALAKHPKANGLDPGLVGACILERWRFPAGFVEAARHRGAGPDRFEEVQVPREALVAVAAGGLGEPWAALLRLPTGRLKEFAVQAAALADAATGQFS